MSGTVYDREFYNAITGASLDSAQRCVPDVISLTKCLSVLDVGCGLGAFLKIFHDLGVSKVFGVDGAYVDERQLLIPKHSFASADLTRPFDVEGRFDLVVSLEVAEHLPATAAKSFVQSLTRHAPIIWFSAAAPGQGGTGHVNEQWPSYWASLFHEYGFRAFDCLRLMWINDDAVAWWYGQNSLIFVQEPLKQDLYDRITAIVNSTLTPMALIHPKLHAARVRELRSYVHDLEVQLSNQLQHSR